jgi:hypothetical protein
MVTLTEQHTATVAVVVVQVLQVKTLPQPKQETVEQALFYIQFGQVPQTLVFLWVMQVVAVAVVELVVVALQLMEAVKELVQDRLHQQELLTQVAVVVVVHTSTEHLQVTSAVTAVQALSSLGIQVKGK